MSANLYILSGQVHTGKSTALRNFLHQKKKDGQTVRGLINPEKELKKWFVDAYTNKEFMMDAAPDEHGVILVGKYRFSQAAFNRAQFLLETESQFPSDWFVIDEIGKLELKGQGLEPAASLAIQQALSQSLNLIIVVRDYLLNEAIGHYNLQEAHVIDVNELNEI